MNHHTDQFYHLSQTQVCFFLPWPQTTAINQLPPCLLCKIFFKTSILQNSFLLFVFFQARTSRLDFLFYSLTVLYKGPYSVLYSLPECITSLAYCYLLQLPVSLRFSLLLFLLVYLMSKKVCKLTCTEESCLPLFVVVRVYTFTDYKKSITMFSIILSPSFFLSSLEFSNSKEATNRWLLSDKRFDV